MSDPEFDVNKLFPGKFFISTTLDVLESKKKMTGHLRRRFIQRAAMAGIIIAIFYVINYTIVAAFDTMTDPPGQLHASANSSVRSPSAGRWCSSTTPSPSCSPRT